MTSFHRQINHSQTAAYSWRRAARIASCLGALLLNLCAVFTASAELAVQYVDIDAASGGDGLAWQTAFQEIQPAIDAAYTAGIGEVWVAEGIYSEQRDSETGALYMRDGVSLYGGFKGNETRREMADPEGHTTTIDGSKGLGGNPAQYSVIFANQCALDGFTLDGAQSRNGYLEKCTECRMSRNIIKNKGIQLDRCANVLIEKTQICETNTTLGGGAINNYCSNNVAIRECAFINNFAFCEYSTSGGAIDASGDNFTLQGCTFRNNKATEGGAVCLLTSNGTALIQDCLFEDNAGTYGGALFIWADDALVTNCVFEGNSATESGGAVWTSADNNGLPFVRFEKSLFEDNSALYGGGIVYHGTIYPDLDRFDRYSVLANCVFRGNIATGGHGNALYAMHFAGCYSEPDQKSVSLREGKNGFPKEGSKNAVNAFAKNTNRREDAGKAAESSAADEAMYAPSGSPKYFTHPFFWPLMIVNCSFVENGTSSTSSTIHADSNYEALYLYNCLFWNNAATEDLGESGEIFEDHNGQYVDPTGMDPCELHYGEMAGCLFDVDPKFVDAANGDYRLQKDSPCIDAGVDTSTLRYGSVVDDYLGRPRGIDGDLLGPNGAGDVDIGACEFVNDDCVILPPHSADMNCNGDFSLVELLRVIQIFNSDGYCCAASPEDTEDGFVPGSGDNHACTPHSSDYNPQDWQVDLSELLRLIQLFNSGGYTYCPDDNTEDGFCLKS